jgi:DNA polymerase I-like protein with 3'-5' exonuclease and polymerase domains
VGNPAAALPPFLANPNPATVYDSGNYVVLDFEVDTSHGDFGNPVHPDNKLLLACWRPGPTHPWTQAWGKTLKCTWGGEYDQQELLDDIASADFLVAHNAKYELGWLRRMGANLHRILPFDTKIAEYVLLGNLASGDPELGVLPHSTSLDMVCRRRELRVKDPVVDIMLHHGINPVEIPPVWLEGRCRQDVETTEQAFLVQREDLRSRGLLPVHFTRCLLTPVLADIEAQGMALDAEEVEKVYAEYRDRLVQLQAEMDRFTGGVNWRSSKQSAQFIYDTLGFAELTDDNGRPVRTAGGQRRTDQNTLAALAAVDDRQREFLALRRKIGKVAAALSKSLEFYVGVVRERSGVFYAQMNQTVTSTHRLSSTGLPTPFRMFDGGYKSAQFQNQPRIFKRLFRAKRPGWLMLDPDGSSIEFRAAAQLGGPDPAALSDIESGWDVHAFTASVLNSTTVEAIKQDEAAAAAQKRDSLRQLAKPDTFKPLYGGEKGTAAQERYYAAFRARYPGIDRAQKRWLAEVLRTKQLRAPWGLVYHWPAARVNKNGRANCKSTVYNNPIQTLATAEIAPIAVVYLWHRIHAEGLYEKARIVNLVHDSAPVELDPAAVEPLVSLVKQAFTRDVYAYLAAVYDMDFRVPLGVGIKIGTHWGSGEEHQWNIWKDGREVKVK